MFHYYINSLTLDNIKAVVKAYEGNEAGHIKKLHDYNEGKQKIRQKETSEGRPNNQVCTNFCSQIVETYGGYINLNAMTTDSDTINAIKPILDECLTDALIGGIAYYLAYYDNGKKTISKLNPATTVIFRDTTISHNVIGAATWNKYHVYEGGLQKEYIDLYVYDETYCYSYHGISIDTMTLTESVPHMLGSIPIQEVRASMYYRGIFEKVIDLQDSYNAIDSSYLDGRETFSNAFLVVKGMGMSQDTADNLIDPENRILNLPINGSEASYLIKPDNASDVIEMLDNIKRRIFTIAHCPDFMDDKFGTYSGIALRYKLTAFIDRVQNVLVSFTPAMEALKVLFSEDFNYTFNSVIPTDQSDLIDLVVKLWGKVSPETLLAQLPFVEDVQKEIAQTKSIFVQE